MADDADRAKGFEQSSRDRNIKAIGNRAIEDQEFDDEGNVICIDCLILIPSERLQANPQANRCIKCQEIEEGN